MKNNEVLHGFCQDYTYDGQGIVKINNRVIFVSGLLKDEEAEIKIIQHKKDFDIGKITKIIKFSPYRIQPKCLVSTSCGGCCFQNLNYEEQIRLKINHVNETLKRIGKIDNKVNNFYSMEDPYYFRNKIQIPFGYDKQGRVIYGFYKSKSHDIVYNQECVIQDKRAIKILKTLQNLIIFYKIPLYNEENQTGFLRNVLIKTSHYYDEVMLVLITSNMKIDHFNEFVNDIKNKCTEVTTIIQNINNKKTNVILGDNERILFGEGYIKDKLCGLDFKISSKSFFQTNVIQTEKLYNTAISLANLNKNDVILDAYCGTGTIGLIASKYVKDVVGVEIVQQAINDAKNNALMNNIKNINFICKDAKDYILEKDFDVIFVDPPRKGLEKEFLDSILKSNVKKIIYISCNPSTLARDLNLLVNKYNIEEIVCVDMFPHSMHVETICYLKK